MSAPNILAEMSEGGPLSYCKTGAKLEGNNQLCPLVSVIHCIIILQAVKAVTKRSHSILLFPKITKTIACSVKSHLGREIYLEFKHEMKEHTCRITGVMILIQGYFEKHNFVHPEAYVKYKICNNLSKPVLTKQLTNSVVPKPEGSSPHSQQPANDPYPQPGESAPHPPNQYP
jgi:hypothetical protein